MTYRLGTISNLPVGAAYDLLLITFPDGFPEGKLVFSLDNTPRKITGLQKVAQLFLKILFTRVGSDLIYPTRGTNFTYYTVNANRVGLNIDLYNNLIAEVKQAESQVKYILNTTNGDPSNMLSSISVLGVDGSKESLSLYMRMLTAAGAEASVSVPFPQLDMNMSKNG